MAKKHKHNPGHGHKAVNGAPQHANKGNLTLPHAGQAMHVSATQDHMAKNIGDHMGTKQQFGHAQPMMASSGKGAPKKFKEKL